MTCGKAAREDQAGMNETMKLLAVYQAEQKLRGLQSRLGAAERFLSEQERQLGAIDQQTELTRIPAPPDPGFHQRERRRDGSHRRADDQSSARR